MPAYLIVEHTITDPAKFQEYGDKVRPLVAKYGGRSLARGSHRVLETKHWLPDRVIIFEFPDMETLNTWYNAPEGHHDKPRLTRSCASTQAIRIFNERDR